MGNHTESRNTEKDKTGMGAMMEGLGEPQDWLSGLAVLHSHPLFLEHLTPVWLPGFPPLWRSHPSICDI